MLSISDLRKKYLGAPEATDEDWEIVMDIALTIMLRNTFEMQKSLNSG